MAAEFVSRIVEGIDAIDVERRFVNVEAVHDTGWQCENLEVASIELDEGGTPRRGAVRPEVEQADAHSPFEDDQVVAMPHMDMNAAQDVRFRHRRVPLTRRNGRRPIGPENLAKPTAWVAVHRERLQSGAERQIVCHRSRAFYEADYTCIYNQIREPAWCVKRRGPVRVSLTHRSGGLDAEPHEDRVSGVVTSTKPFCPIRAR
jgi:hypothetical protein